MKIILKITLFLLLAQKTISSHPIEEVEFFLDSPASRIDLKKSLNFSRSKEIDNTVFILTHPKSATHLLLYSIIKTTGRPVRERAVGAAYTEESPYFDDLEMNYPLSSEKPVIYWGHEYFNLYKLNKRQNKLIFIIRDYKELLLSNTILAYNLRPASNFQEILGPTLQREIFQKGTIFMEFLLDLELFHSWEPSRRCLVRFEDLVKHPERFVPQVLKFIEDASEYQSFVDNYDSFKKEILVKYRQRDNGSGSESDLRFFRRFVSKEILEEIDAHMMSTYPVLWENYLKEFQEK